jgi:8-oxo-dGTP pyrophosphatase MutT (NUDIX family)
MLGAKVYRDYPVMREIVQDIDERFILGLDHEVLTDSKMIFFKIQKAFWYYKDRHEKLIKERKIPGMPLDMFGQLLIEESQLLSRVYPHEQRALKYKEWQDYLRRVPRLGAICLNPSGDKVLMIQPFGRNRKCLQFPRGKLHAGEEHAKAAAREVWEECGIRIENLMDENIFFEAYVEQTLHKLYLVFPVMEELVPSIQCNKEIEQVLWFPVTNLPGWTSGSGDDKSFFGVAPFVQQIKGFVRRTFGSVPKLPPTVKILKRPSKKDDETFEENKEDPEADRSNAVTFPDDHREGGWSFEDMVNANSRLGVQSTYSDASFEATYNVVPPIVSSQKQILDTKRILDAFAQGWDEGDASQSMTRPRFRR